MLIGLRPAVRRPRGCAEKKVRRGAVVAGEEALVRLRMVVMMEAIGRIGGGLTSGWSGLWMRVLRT